MSRNLHVTLVSLAALILTASIVAAQEPDGPPVFEQQLLAGDPGEGAWFGENLAIDGDTVVVGARHEDLDPVDTDYWDNGAVYVYVRDQGVWTLQQKITSDIVEWSLSFGCSVDISGDTLTIGAYYFNGYQGFAEVWVRTADVWSFQQRLFADPAGPNQWFGFSTAVDGDSVIVGAFNAVGAGSAHIYTRSGSVWTLEQAITAPVPDPSDRFGIEVDIEGDTAVIGDDNPPGLAHVFTRTAGTWTFGQSLIPAGMDNERFGRRIDLDGDQVIIGDGMADVDTVTVQYVDAGAAHVFTRTAGVWTEEQRLVSDDPEQDARFGLSSAIDGDVVLVGERYRDLDAVSDSGAAFVFHRSGGTWNSIALLAASDPDLGAEFGSDVALAGTSAVIGAWMYDHSGFDDAGGTDVFLVPGTLIFGDGFEDGTTDGWDVATS